MRSKLFSLWISLILLFFSVGSAKAQEPLKLNVVYPSRNEIITNTQSYFFVGSTSPDAVLTINDKPVTVHSDGTFVAVVPIVGGANSFVIKSVSPNNDICQKTFVIKTPTPRKAVSATTAQILQNTVSPADKMILKAGDKLRVRFQGSPGGVATFKIGNNVNIPMKELSQVQAGVAGIYEGSYVINAKDNFQNQKVSVTLVGKNLDIAQASWGDVSTLPENSFINGEVITDYALVRDFPDQNRLTPMAKGAKVDISGQRGKYYRIELTPQNQVWMFTKDIKTLGIVSNRELANINEVSAEDNGDFVNLKIKMDENLPFQISQNYDNTMELNIYGGKNSFERSKYWILKRYFKDVTFDETDSNVLKIKFAPNFKHLWGYDYHFENGNFVLSLKKPPCIDRQNPLYGQVIAIDAGHGGSETGSVGPTGMPEKTINLAIAQNLKQELENAGATVVMTRNCDESVELYSRPEIAKAKKAVVLVSIHNNALPDGQNPYKIHGTTTYFYQPQSNLLAQTLQRQMVTDLGFPDLGVKKGSLVLTRPTIPLAVLLEIGFMIYPDEYSQLVTPEFQQKAAVSIKTGLEKFFLESTEN